MNVSSVIFSIDAETVGLYGEPFAFGWSLRNAETGIEMSYGYDSCPLNQAKGPVDDRKWVMENVCPHLPKEATVSNPNELCERVWKIWADVKREYDKLYCVADFGYPVEASLFRRCVKDDLEKRKFEGPFPLHEVETACLIANIDRKDFPLQEDEKPVHHPTSDARYAGRLFFEALKTKAKQNS